MKIISIIPARGGSKRIFRKNLKKLDAKPLITYTINEALKLKKINEVIVSTDDNEIAKISKELGANVILRPKELAEDDSPVIKAVIHVMEQLKEKYDQSTLIILLQPTSPLRTKDDIEKCIDLFFNNECESVLSICELSHPPEWNLKIKRGFLKPLHGYINFEKRTQDCEKVFIANGAIFIATLETLQRYNSFLTKKTIPYVMPIERSIDIDNEIDFILAELLMKNKSYNKNKIP